MLIINISRSAGIQHVYKTPLPDFQYSLLLIQILLKYAVLMWIKIKWHSNTVSLVRIKVT